MAFKCNGCGKPLYNRRRKNCEFCGGVIPEADRLSGKQQAFIEKLKVDEAKQHREAMEQHKDDVHGGGWGGGLGGIGF